MTYGSKDDETPMQLLKKAEKNGTFQKQFCEYCGAGVGEFFREGEGTCNRCDPFGRGFQGLP